MLPFGLYRVSGDSMQPTYQPGDVLVGRRWLIHPHVGDVVVVIIEGRPIIKRIHQINGGSIEVIGDNVVASTDSRHFGALPITQITAKITNKIKSQ